MMICTSFDSYNTNQWENLSGISWKNKIPKYGPSRQIDLPFKTLHTLNFSLTSQPTMGPTTKIVRGQYINSYFICFKSEPCNCKSPSIPIPIIQRTKFYFQKTYTHQLTCNNQRLTTCNIFWYKYLQRSLKIKKT